MPHQWWCHWFSQASVGSALQLPAVAGLHRIRLSLLSRRRGAGGRSLTSAPFTAKSPGLTLLQSMCPHTTSLQLQCFLSVGLRAGTDPVNLTSSMCRMAAC